MHLLACSFCRKHPLANQGSCHVWLANILYRHFFQRSVPSFDTFHPEHCQTLLTCLGMAASKSIVTLQTLIHEWEISFLRPSQSGSKRLELVSVSPRAEHGGRWLMGCWPKVGLSLRDGLVWEYTTSWVTLVCHFRHEWWQEEAKRFFEMNMNWTRAIE